MNLNKIGDLLHTLCTMLANVSMQTHSPKMANMAGESRDGLNIVR